MGRFEFRRCSGDVEGRLSERRHVSSVAHVCANQACVCTCDTSLVPWNAEVVSTAARLRPCLCLFHLPPPSLHSFLIFDVTLHPLNLLPFFHRCHLTLSENTHDLLRYQGDVSMQKLLKSFAPKKPSSSCCGGGKEQLAAAVVPPGDHAAGDGTTPGAGTATTAVSDTDVGTNAAGGYGGDMGGGWLRGVCCFRRCCRTSSGNRLGAVSILQSCRFPD